jgi:hypothetical protein
MVSAFRFRVRLPLGSESLHAHITQCRDTGLLGHIAVISTVLASTSQGIAMNQQIGHEEATAASKILSPVVPFASFRVDSR